MAGRGKGAKGLGSPKKKKSSPKKTSPKGPKGPKRPSIADYQRIFNEHGPGFTKAQYMAWGMEFGKTNHAAEAAAAEDDEGECRNYRLFERGVMPLEGRKTPEYMEKYKRKLCKFIRDNADKYVRDGVITGYGLIAFEFNRLYPKYRQVGYTHQTTMRVVTDEMREHYELPLLDATKKRPRQAKNSDDEEEEDEESSESPPSPKKKKAKVAVAPVENKKKKKRAQTTTTTTTTTSAGSQVFDLGGGKRVFLTAKDMLEVNKIFVPVEEDDDEGAEKLAKELQAYRAAKKLKEKLMDAIKAENAAKKAADVPVVASKKPKKKAVIVAESEDEESEDQLVEERPAPKMTTKREKENEMLEWMADELAKEMAEAETLTSLKNSVESPKLNPMTPINQPTPKDTPVTGSSIHWIIPESQRMKPLTLLPPMPPPKEHEIISETTQAPLEVAEGSRSFAEVTQVASQEASQEVPPTQPVVDDEVRETTASEVHDAVDALVDATQANSVSDVQDQTPENHVRHGSINWGSTKGEDGTPKYVQSPRACPNCFRYASSMDWYKHCGKDIVVCLFNCKKGKTLYKGSYRNLIVINKEVDGPEAWFALHESARDCVEL